MIENEDFACVERKLRLTTAVEGTSAVAKAYPTLSRWSD